MIEPKLKWIYSYTMPCTQRGNEEEFRRLLEKGKFVKILGGDYSREKVREYFLVPHNIAAFQTTEPNHYALPYRIKEIGKNGLVCVLIDLLGKMKGQEKTFSRSELESAKNLGVFIPEDKILIAHAGIIAETCQEKDLEEPLNKLREQFKNSLIEKF